MADIPEHVKAQAAEACPADHSWLKFGGLTGAIAGAGIGGAVAGPIGVAVGAALGAAGLGGMGAAKDANVADVCSEKLQTPAVNNGHTGQER